jgi:poly(A) polymerase
MCATHNITLSTKQIITRELERGGDIVDKIFTGHLQWKDLFEKHTFFTQGYKYYLGVVSTSRTEHAQNIWSGLVESKVRHLVTDLEHDELINLAHPFTKGFERVHRCENEEDVDAVIHGDLRRQVIDVKTETANLSNDPKHSVVAESKGDNIPMVNGIQDVKTDGIKDMTLYTTTHYIGLELNQSTLFHHASAAANGL